MVRPTLARAINRPRLAFGCEKSIFFCACIIFVFVLFRAYHLSGSVLTALISACLCFSTVTKGAALLTKNDPKIISRWLWALFHPALYDPGKFKRFDLEIEK